MKIIEKIKDKNYFIGGIIIVIALMLFEDKVSGIVASYISLPPVVLSFISLFIILFIIKLATEEILEI